MSLLPDLEVSDLKKSQSNHKSNGDNLSMHPAKTIHPEIIILVRIFECRIQILTAFICGTMSGNKGKDYHHLTCGLIETFQDHSPQDQVAETPTSKSQMIDDALVSDIV